MSATDELRRMLDERGVEWIGTDFTEPTPGHATNTSLDSEHHDAVFVEYVDGTALRLFDLTPAQAIEAIFGRGRCTMEFIWADEIDGECYECTKCNGVNFTHSGKPFYCCNCGAKVVDL